MDIDTRIRIAEEPLTMMGLSLVAVPFPAAPVARISGCHAA
jgi:hypothetical protein